MSLLPGNPQSYLEVFVFGVTYGLIFCTSACLPYIASYIAGIGVGFRKGVAVTIIYNIGRVTAYALIGAAIGLFKIILSNDALTSFQAYSSFTFAIVAIAIGANLILKSKKKSSTYNECTVSTNCHTSAINRVNEKFDFRAFILGLSRGLIICPPLLLLLVAYSASGATAIDSLLIAVIFGTGTTLSPILFLGGATGWLLRKAPLFKKWISIGGGFLLIIFGFITLINAIILSG